MVLDSTVKLCALHWHFVLCLAIGFNPISLPFNIGRFSLLSMNRDVHLGNPGMVTT
jgi:hypothetical protein